MTNKEVVDKLQSYYLTQDTVTIARLCANYAIDINRFYNFEHLSIEEKFKLIQITKYNLNVTLKIIEGKGLGEELTFSNYDEQKDNND